MKCLFLGTKCPYYENDECKPHDFDFDCRKYWKYLTEEIEDEN